MDELAAPARAALSRPGLGDARVRGRSLARRRRSRELSALTIGSRPAARGRDAARRHDSSRCAPFRGSLPGRSRAPTCPAGTARARLWPSYRARHGEAGLRHDCARCTWSGRSSAPCSTRRRWCWPRRTCRSRRATRRWRPGAGARDLWARIRTEYETAVEQILAVTGRARLLDNMPVLQRSIELAQPVRRLVVGTAGAPAGPTARAARQ